MIINTAKLIDRCQKILTAVDSSALNIASETIEIEVANSLMRLLVTNGEYVVEEKVGVDTNETFKATVKASVFLKLVCQTTTDTVEFKIDNDNLVIVGNGKYTLPMVYNNDKLIEISMIPINNPTVEFDIGTDILQSIANTNSKELTKLTSQSYAVQRMYYIDQDGCITFTTGACVNNFKLEKDVKFLLNQKIVKLFKLFTTDKVKFTLGYDEDSNGGIQAKARFENDFTTITTLLINDDSMVNSVPVKAIRKRAENTYDYSVVIDKNIFLKALTRALTVVDIMNNTFNKNYAKFEFSNQALVIKDMDGHTYEESLYYSNNVENIDGTYTAIIELNDLKLTLENSDSEYVTLNFGDHQAFVCVKNNVYNIIPEVKIV